MKILHVTDWANGGLATYLDLVCSAQLKKHEVYILASASNSEDRIIQRKDFISLDPYSRSIKGMMYALKITREHIKTIKPDILHVHSSFAGVFARLATLGIQNRPKIIYCAHGWSFLMQGSQLKRQVYKCIENLLAHRTDAIITISENEHIGAIKAGIDKHKLYKIEHGISMECEKLDPDFLAAHAFESGKLNILFLGRYDYAKGFDWLMNFITQYSQKNICWHCAGKSIVDQSVVIPENVIDHGWVAYESIPQLLLRCDAVIIPSRWEGFGLSAIEAMKYSKPVIASNNGALPELISHGENGLLFDMDCEMELVNILEGLQSNVLKEVGEIGHTVFIEKYTDIKMIKKLETLVARIAK